FIESASAVTSSLSLHDALPILAEIAASVPATALFPVLMLGLIAVSGGLNLIAVLLMLMGTQWYLLFNVIAGAAAIPEDLRHTARSEEHTSELQSHLNLVCRLLL